MAAAVRLTNDGCILTGAQGVARLDKQALACLMKLAAYTLDDFKISDDLQVSFLRDDVAIVAYKIMKN